MNNSFALRIINVSKKLISKFGSNIKLVEFQQGAFNPDTGKITKAPIEHDVRAHFANYDSSEVVKGLVDLDDVKVLLVADYQITKSWSLMMGSMVFEIINIKTTIVQDTTLLYELQCRSRTV